MPNVSNVDKVNICWYYWLGASAFTWNYTYSRRERISTILWFLPLLFLFINFACEFRLIWKTFANSSVVFVCFVLVFNQRNYVCVWHRCFFIHIPFSIHIYLKLHFFRRFIFHLLLAHFCRTKTFFYFEAHPNCSPFSRSLIYSLKVFSRISIHSMDSIRCVYTALNRFKRRKRDKEMLKERNTMLFFFSFSLCWTSIAARLTSDGSSLEMHFVCI